MVGAWWRCPCLICICWRRMFSRSLMTCSPPSSITMCYECLLWSLLLRKLIDDWPPCTAAASICVSTGLILYDCGEGDLASFFFSPRLVEFPPVATPVDALALEAKTLPLISLPAVWIPPFAFITPPILRSFWSYCHPSASFFMSYFCASMLF